MQIPKLPANEAERLKVLYDLQILDTPREERFDRLVRITQSLFNVPIALIGLIDEERQWYKSCVGLPNTEVDRNGSFCAHAILSPDTLYIPDARLDSRFADHPAVLGAPYVRFYVGAPLILKERYCLGTLCLVDYEPRHLSDEQLKLLRDLADLVQQQLETQLSLDLEKMLSEEKARHQLLFETMIDGIAIIDQYGHIENSNLALQTLLGLSANTLYHMPLQQLFASHCHRDYQDYLNQCVQQYQTGQINHRCELQIRHQEGHFIDVELLFSPMRLHERLLFTAIIRDMTERKAIERMKNEFISTVSHELRTPLTSIRGAIGLVLSKAAEGLSPKAKMLLNTASRNSERLSLLINDILDLEKIESGKLDFDLKPIDLAQLIQQAITGNEGYAVNHQVALVLAETLVTAPVYADDHRLLQVFSNLISNAIKYSPPQGRVELRLQDQDEQWRIGVRDHGRGIPEAFRERIFQRFAQADASDTREKNGTGLGLTISKAIIERHGGNIAYHSVIGEGTEFFFTLPKLVSTASEASQAHILICEDNADVALILSELLAQESMSSEIAYTAHQAKARLAQQHYDAMLLDLNLPDQDGMELLLELRQNPDYAQLPIVIVSGRAEQHSKQLVDESVAVIEWLQKPIDRQLLRHALNRCLSSEIQKPSILHIEDEPDVIQVTQMLVAEVADYYFAVSVEQARSLLQQRTFDLVILDLNLPDGSGLELLSAINVNSQVLVFTGTEMSSVLSEQIGLALTKASTSNQQLLNTIKKLIAKNESQHD
ncbi:ATP-binding protein [Agitococcus lubricus]|uniref:histidine kinase n=1 Tax=Agitococcus lubricus TaxID=1077255 RepID=A0A2T5J436_9GAMM|nr:ATP-binding protein [Agitococcus lubricus]PTQ91362.1 PAS domain S-box-containing protein [Agitococcus lubricus]